jgi:hypothetical protein
VMSWNFGLIQVLFNMMLTSHYLRLHRKALP